MTHDMYLATHSLFEGVRKEAGGLNTHESCFYLCALSLEFVSENG